MMDWFYVGVGVVAVAQMLGCCCLWSTVLILTALAVLRWVRWMYREKLWYSTDFFRTVLLHFR